MLTSDNISTILSKSSDVPSIIVALESCFRKKRIMNDFLKIAKKISTNRGRPLYVIKLDEIKEEHSIQCQEHFKGKSFSELDVLLHSPGGDIETAFRIAKIIRKHCQKANGIIPIWAKSATTLISLAMDQLILGEIGELGPLDALIRESGEGEGPRYKSALNRFKALDQLQQYALETLDVAVKLVVERSGLKMSEAIEMAIKFTATIASPLFSQVDPGKLGENARSLDLGKEYGLRILHRYMGCDKEKAKELLTKLVKGYPSHSFIIDVEESKELGLNASYADGEFAEQIEDIRLELIKCPEDYLGFVGASPARASRKAKQGKKTVANLS